MVYIYFLFIFGFMQINANTTLTLARLFSVLQFNLCKKGRSLTLFRQKLTGVYVSAEELAPTMAKFKTPFGNSLDLSLSAIAGVDHLDR